MRIFEVEGRPLVPTQTDRFRKNFSAFARSDASLKAALEDFIIFKCNNPVMQHSRKDTAFNNQKLKGYRHEHLVLGKILLIYQIADGQLRLCDCVDHKAIDGAAKALIAYLHGLTPTSFTGAAPKVESLSSADKRIVTQTIYDLTQGGEEVLRTALSGDTTDLEEWLTVEVDKPFSLIVASFGGLSGLQDEIRTAMRNVGLK